jgi:hypothetical protein
LGNRTVSIAASDAYEEEDSGGGKAKRLRPAALHTNALLPKFRSDHSEIIQIRRMFILKAERDPCHRPP